MLACSPKAARKRAATVHPDAPTHLISHSEAASSSAAGNLQSRIAASGGLEHRLRIALWPALLNLAPWPKDYISLSTAISSADHDAIYAENAAKVETVDAGMQRTISADVPRTDGNFTQSQCDALRDLLLAHCVLEPSWGYFQGMNDIARVVIAVCESRADEAVPPTPNTPPSIEQSAANGVSSHVSIGTTFWLLRGVLSHSSQNWAHANLDGVWRQARAVRAVLRVADPKLAKRLEALEVSKGQGFTESQPLAFLFGPIFLRLKRELASLEECMRLWEVSWAYGQHFHVLCVAALVVSQKGAIMQLRGASSAELHQMFGRLHGTKTADDILSIARSIKAKPGVLAALESSFVELEGTAASVVPR